MNPETGEPMFYETAKNDHGLPHDPFKACLVPRPIGWISTVSREGVVNLAPFSLFNQLAEDPPFVFFAGGCRPGTGQRKDSVVNAEETGEFVFNMATYAVKDQVNLSSRYVRSGVDEFELAGPGKLPSRLVKPPRVAESPVHFECRHHVTLRMPSNTMDAAHVVIGRVVAIHIADDVIDEKGEVDLLKIRPLARLGYMDYTTVDSLFSMPIEALVNRSPVVD